MIVNGWVIQPLVISNKISVLNNTVTAGEQPRPIYPEDSYVQFVITTKVQSETAVPVEGADGTTVPGGEL